MSISRASAGVGGLLRLGWRLLLGAALILPPVPATAGWSEAVAAYERGDYPTAFRELMPLAVAGDPSAQFNIGVMYDNGEGVPEDDAEAVRWYRLAADQSEAKAQCNLGLMYANGDGVPQDDVLAYMWLNLAAAHSLTEEKREAYAEWRDHVAARLTRAQRARGQELASNWRPGMAASSQAGFAPSAEAALRAHRGIQQRLVDLGYDPGPVDGVIGPKTRAAIRAFQRDVGLPADGQVSDRLVAALSDAAEVPTNRNDRTLDAPSHEAVVAGGRRPDPSSRQSAQLHGTGTGFAVSPNGHVVTNHHVVSECVAVSIQPPRAQAVTAAIVALDPNNDLALLEAPVGMPGSAQLDDRGIRPGDGVVAVGFPLHGLLASEASVTIGSVGALAGIGNDTRLLQVTVPVQPGNSGGPLLDLHGRVVGVVVGKLDALRVASATGDIPQNVNFAIKASVVRAFLEASGVGDLARDPSAATSYRIPQSPATVAAEAKAFTVLVECWR